MSFMPFSTETEPDANANLVAGKLADDLQAKSVQLQPRQTVDVEIPIPAALNLGITFMADSQVGVSLANHMGVVIGKNAAGSAESRSWFRSIFYDKATLAGTWKIHLENASDKEAEVLLVVWHDAVK